MPKAFWQIVAVTGLATCSVATSGARAQDPPEANEVEDARKVQLEFIKREFSGFELFRKEEPSQPLGATDDPVLRWSNPIRNSFSDGALFLWLRDKQPAAAVTISLRGEGNLWVEMASLSSDPLRCARKSGDFWTPAAGSLVAQKLGDAPPPAKTPRLRLVQMRRLAEEFAIRTEPKNEQPTQLRLLSQPTYRYGEEGTEILDGGLFAFAETTDPEALLLLEAIQPAGDKPGFWQFTLARMTSRPVVARLNDKPVWSVDGYWANPKSPNDPYMERQLGVIVLPDK